MRDRVQLEEVLQVAQTTLQYRGLIINHTDHRSAVILLEKDPETGEGTTAVFMRFSEFVLGASNIVLEEVGFCAAENLVCERGTARHNKTGGENDFLWYEGPDGSTQQELAALLDAIPVRVLGELLRMMPDAYLKGYRGSFTQWIAQFAPLINKLKANLILTPEQFEASAGTGPY